MKKTGIITCIECPRGCRVTVEQDGDSIKVLGNRCSKGEEYAIRETRCPMRTLTTTVRTTFPGMKRLPVRTSTEIPLKDIFFFMEQINRYTLKERLPHGAEISCGLPGDVRLIVTGDPRPEAGDPAHWEGSAGVILQGGRTA
ncbi:MAG: DUF1667 domain-containing protein [Spirochaetales bacterium]|nr:DUF1667 domain-containing protein [Spirochaetales bacterium]